MANKRTFWVGCWLAALAAVLAGCPQTQLNVSPTALSFGEDQSLATVTLSATGSGAVTWAIDSLPAWLTASSMSGALTGESRVITFTCDRTGLASGLHQDNVVISSSAGTRTIAVSVTVTAGPALTVEPASLDFGSSATSRTLTVRNSGAGTLVWSAASPFPTGFSANPATGSLTSGGSQTVTVTFTRQGLPGGAYTGTLSFSSNGGAVGVPVTASVQALAVAPSEIDFGADLDEAAFTLSNSGSSDVHWTIDGPALPDWAAVSSLSGTLPPGADATVVCTVDRTGLGPGVTEGAVAIASDGGSETVALRVEGPDPRLTVTPAALDFGATENTLSFEIRNTGTGALTWTIEEGVWAHGTWTPQETPWLSVTGPLTGQTEPGAPDTIAVAVDRTQVTPQPDTPYTGYLRVLSGTGEDAVVTVSQLTLPPTLRVLPQNLEFGTTYVEQRVHLWNGGLGVVNWRLDASGHPAWATLTPVDGSGIASGALSGADAAVLTVRVDRTGLPPADQNYTWSFEITAEDGSGNPLAPATVTATMNVAKTAAISIDTGTNGQGAPNVDQTGVPFVPFGTTETTRTFLIRNVGLAPLVWSIDTTALPGWVTAVSPAQSTLAPQQAVTVTVTVDRTGLSYGSAVYEMAVESNDPLRSAAPVRLEMQVPKRLVIGVTPSELALGLYAISDSFDVANLGDPGSMLNFEVTSDKPWLYFYPETGSSEGTMSQIKDWRTVNISVDRAQLESTGGTARLTIVAFETDSEGRRVPMTSVAPKTVAVSVEAAPLSFEAAKARTRIPSLVRFVLLMRDIAYEPIPLAAELLDDYVDSFSVFEKDVPVERTESGQFLTSGARLRTNVVILLDYSGSMYEAARSVSDTTISGAPDPLQALYSRCIGALIDELPPFYSVGLMVFHERSQGSRTVVAPDYGSVFTTDKAVLHERLNSITIIDHGATELLPALADAAMTLEGKDYGALRLPFDDTDVRALICVSDGRLTTPPGSITITRDFIAGLKVRLFAIGWGKPVLHEPLARIAAGTGGHYYPTPLENTGLLDGLGNVVTLPMVSALEDHCTTLDPAVDPCDQSVAKDLQSQVVLSYVTLTEDTPVTVRVAATFDNPNDGEGSCLPEQGLITGSLVQKDLNLLSIAGDVRLGQLSLRTDGLRDGAADVVVRAEYLPRNTDALEFEATAPEPFTVTLVPRSEGGIVEDWTLTPLPDNRYRLERPAPVAPLKYGAYGDLAALHFTGIALDTFRVSFAVTDPVYNAGDSQGKYFVCPDTIPVDAAGFFAPAFPTPAVKVIEPTTSGDVIDLGTDGKTGRFELRNVGGNHVPTRVWLNWFLDERTGYATVSQNEGTLVSTLDTDTVTLTLDRSLPADDYLFAVPIVCDGGSLGLEPYRLYVYVSATVLPPDLAVTSEYFEPGTQTLAFVAGVDSMAVTLANTGQSTLHWAVEADALPRWLQVTPTQGSVALGKAVTVPVSVVRAGLAPGTYMHTFEIQSDGGSASVTVTLAIP